MRNPMLNGLMRAISSGADPAARLLHSKSHASRTGIMGSVIAALVAALAVLLFSPQPAVAHPHVWVTVKSEIVYDDSGAISGIRHAWMFDDLYSAYALQGLDSNGDGDYSREELAELAQINVESLNEFDYFTYAQIEGEKVALSDPVDYFVERGEDGILTLFFTLPVKIPVATGTLKFAMQVYDPTFFIDFTLAGETPVILSKNAPAGCRAIVASAADEKPDISQVPEDQLTGESKLEFGVSYVPVVEVGCAGA